MWGGEGGGLRVYVGAGGGGVRRGMAGERWGKDGRLLLPAQTKATQAKLRGKGGGNARLETVWQNREEVVNEGREEVGKRL